MKNHKKILYIVDSSIDITGAFICIKNEAKILKDKYDTVLVLPKNSKIKYEDLDVFNKVIYLPIVNIRKSFFNILAYLPSLAYCGWKLKKIMQKDNCSILQINDFYLMQGIVANLFGFKGNIFTWVRIDPRRYGSFLSKYWLKYSYKYSDKIVANSNFIKNILPRSSKNVLLYDPMYIRETITNSINKEELATKKIVYISNYIRGKGQQYAIEAFLNIADKFPETELHFYGGDMGLKKNKFYLEELKEMSKNSNKIYFHGFINNIETILSSAYIALNFSDSESFSLTVLEASYYGVPVISTKSGGPQEIILNNETGILVNVGNVDDIEVAMNKLLLNKQLTIKIGKNAKIHVKKQFSEKVFKKNIINIFEIKKGD